MSKDMMNIDDFVRKTLGNHPEQEDNNAWLRMKALLDENMPEKPVPFYIKWRKPLALLGAAVLAGALCVGGYQMNWLRPSGESIPASKPATHTNVHSITEANVEKQHNNPSSQDSHSSASGQISSNKHTETAAIQAGHINNNPISNEKRKHSASKQISHSATESAKLTAQKSHKQPSNTKTAATASGKQLLASSKTNNANNTSLTDNRPFEANATNNKPTTSQANSNKQADAKTASNKQQPLKPSQADISSKITADATTLALAPTPQVDQNSSIQHPNTNSNEKTDSIEVTSIITKNVTSKRFPKKTLSVVDTVGNTKIAVSGSASEKQNSTQKTTASNASFQKKVAEQQQQSAQQEKLVPASSVKINKEPLAAQTNNLASNSTQEKQNKKKSFFQIFKNININEAIQTAKADLGKSNLYYGFAGGVNYSFNNNQSFQGIHFGPTFELEFNEHWSLFGSIKYFNRSGKNKTVDDSYVAQNSYLDSVSGANYYFRILTDSTNRYFKFSTLHSFELPLTVRYSSGNLYAFGGVNLAYYLPVNVEEVNKPYFNINPQTIITNSTQKPILREEAPKIYAKDFGARFGIGCVAGVGYKISPSWQADARVVYNFWDNANTSGAKALSKDFFKIPSFQLTVGYQLFRDKQKATYGPTDPASR